MRVLVEAVAGCVFAYCFFEFKCKYVLYVYIEIIRKIV